MNQDQRLLDTRESAVAWLEDYDVLREIAYASQSRAVDIRHASAIMRRWLIEGVLQRVAGPRIGKVRIETVDNSSAYRAAKSGEMILFLSGGMHVHGIQIAAQTISRGPAPKLPGYHPDKRIELSVQSFLRQKVIFVEGEWLTRHDIIQFIARKDRGVHDDRPSTTSELLLSDFRYQIAIGLKRGRDGGSSSDGVVPSISVSLGPPAKQFSSGNYAIDNINGVLLELLATIFLSVASGDLLKLRDYVARELAAGEP